jgi:2-polyprenyl-3-methyl-5-hydroxy-6-metoxy-1,4-benzoquinol methylase
VTESPRRDHYSYTVYADPVMARTFDDRRFGGPIGAFVASTQAQVLGEFVGAVRQGRILDVGTGTGRAALLLARGGAVVTGVDASEQMLQEARRQAAAEGLDVRLLAGDAHALEFADRSFDAVVCLRVLMHAPDWRTCIGEICRVAGQLVILDYPSTTSAAAIESLGRRALRAMGRRTEAYRVFSKRAIAAELARSGFQVRAVHRQFVLPIALHKAVGSQRFTSCIERQLERAGLLRVFGSPVTLVAERCASS